MVHLGGQGRSGEYENHDESSHNTPKMQKAAAEQVAPAAASKCFGQPFLFMKSAAQRPRLNLIFLVVTSASTGTPSWILNLSISPCRRSRQNLMNSRHAGGSRASVPDWA